MAKQSVSNDVLFTEIKYIKEGVNEIKAHLIKCNDDIIGLNNRVTIVETSDKFKNRITNAAIAIFSSIITGIIIKFV